MIKHCIDESSLIGPLHPMTHAVPLNTTGTLLLPPPATTDRNVVAVALVTNEREPTSAVVGRSVTRPDPCTYPAAMRPGCHARRNVVNAGHVIAPSKGTGGKAGGFNGLMPHGAECHKR
jgi:hypothetical protein